MKKRYIKLKSVPKIKFAHVFGTENYTNTLGVHEQQIEITYIQSGVFDCVQSEERYSLQPGRIFSNLYDSPLHIDTKGTHTHHTVCFTLSFEIAENDSEGAICLPNSINSGNKKNHITALMDEIICNFTLHTGNDTMLAGLFLQILGIIDSVARAPQNQYSYGNLRYVRLAKDYIYKHLNEPIRQSEIAAYLDITPEYLCTIFKKSEGVTLMQFINRIKLEQITSLMEAEHITLARASEIYGYNDPNYVSRLYKKYFHINITDVKKIRQN